MMANIPEEAENNLFMVYIDKHSLIKNFHKVFDIESEEIAIRFYNMFGHGQKSSQKKDVRTIDINCFYHTVKNICNVVSTLDYFQKL